MDSRDTALSYIDKLFVTFQRIEDSFWRLVRLQVLVSTLLLLIVSGIVSAQDSIVISIIKLDLPLWTVIGGGSVTVGIVATIVVLQNYHSVRIHEEIDFRYHELGYDVPATNSRIGLGLYSSPIDIIANVWGKSITHARGFGTIGKVAGIAIAASVVILLPVIAQMAAMIKLGADFGWTWKVWLPLSMTLIGHTVTSGWAVIATNRL
jgi:hypothetical protein